MGRLDKRVSIVTGAASGIGHEIATALTSEGSTVIGFDLRAAGKAMLPCDVTSEADIRRAVANVLAEHNRIDILVNAAGIWLPGTIIEPDGVSVWDATMAVNLRGLFLVSRAVLPVMIAQGGGSIIHIGSISGIIGNHGSAAYSASKGAVISLTRAMAVDHGRDHVRVNCVCPGMTRTPMLDATEAGLTPQEAARYNAQRIAAIPLGRLGTPADLAPAVVYLASDEARWVTGSCFTIDGGYIAGR